MEIRSNDGKIGNFDDIKAIVTLLASLLFKFAPVITSLGEINEHALVTLDMVKGSLLDYDLKQKDERKIKRNEPIEKNEAAFYLN